MAMAAAISATMCRDIFHWILVENLNFNSCVMAEGGAGGGIRASRFPAGFCSTENSRKAACISISLGSDKMPQAEEFV